MSLTSSPAKVDSTVSRLCVSALLASFCFGLWYDSGSGYLPLLLATGVLLVCCCVHLPRLLPEFFPRHPIQSLFLLLVLVLLVVLYQTSLSQDLSFTPTWLLAASLISYALLAVQSRGTQMTLWWWLVGVSACMAVFSVWQFFTLDIRANKPINDPNNYASLLYLLWIPSLHLLLARLWAQQPLPIALQGLGLFGTALVMATMFATESRAGLIIIGVAFACWWGLALSRRFTLRDVAAHTLMALVVLGVCTLAMGTAGVAPGGDNTFTGGMTVRFGLIAEAWALFLERPLGVGFGTFAVLYAARRPLWDQITAGRFVHNDYVQFLLEGGPLLLLALLCVGLWAMYLLRRALLASVGDARFARAGFALAACALFAHAHINFVFYLYTLPLLLAVVLVLASDTRQDKSALKGIGALTSTLAEGLARVPTVAVWVPLLFGWIAWGYLVIDGVTEGVIAGQRGLPFVSELRQSPADVQRYARLAQRLNADRGLPLLADAALAAQSSAAKSPQAGADEAAYALRTFRRAIAVDPWNTSTYLELYKLFQLRPALLRVANPEEYPDRLLQRALELDRGYLPAVAALLDLFKNDAAQHEAVLLQFVAPWVEFIARADLQEGKRYLAELNGIIPAAEHARLSALLVALGNKRREEETAGGKPATVYIGPGV